MDFEAYGDNPFAVPDLWRKSVYTLEDSTKQSIFKDVNTGTFVVVYTPAQRKILILHDRDMHRGTRFFGLEQ